MLKNRNGEKSEKQKELSKKKYKQREREKVKYDRTSRNGTGNELEETV